MPRWILAACVLSTACGSGEGGGTATASSTPPRVELAAPSFASVSAPPAVAASASASLESRAPPLDFAALRARFPDSERWPSGPGVACGTERCAVGAVCCEASSPRQCLPSARASECTQGGNLAAFCDESTDCAGAERCCQGITDDGILATCATPARCARTWDRPGGFGIPAQEICARGGRCKNPAYTCVDAKDDSVSGGQCVSARARVRCGAAGECPTDRPWCLWDAARHIGECIPRGAWRREPGVLECDSAADCPGGQCCGTGQSATFCSTTECEPELAYAPMVCSSPKDCVAAGRVATCEPDESLPPGMGGCSFSEPPPP